MANIFNQDFRDFIDSFNKHKVDYILVGGMAVILNGYIRTTGDMDVWVRKSADNYKNILQAFYSFGMPIFDMSEERFLSEQFDVWSFGRDPVRIDLMTEVTGLSFDEAFSNARYFTEDDVSFRFLHVNELVKAKQSSGRHRDIDDIEQLNKNTGK